MKTKKPAFAIEPIPVPEPAEFGAAVAARRQTEIALTKPRKTIDVALLVVSGNFLHQDNEAAACQKMSPSSFSQKMRKRDPDTGLTYREIFDNARAGGRATQLRTMIEQSRMMNSAGVNANKFVMANEFGWSEKRLEERTGTVNHRHTHQQIPADEKLHKMTDEELAELAQGQAGGKPATRH